MKFTPFKKFMPKLTVCLVAMLIVLILQQICAASSLQMGEWIVFTNAKGNEARWLSIVGNNGDCATLFFDHGAEVQKISPTELLVVDHGDYRRDKLLVLILSNPSPKVIDVTQSLDVSALGPLDERRLTTTVGNGNILIKISVAKHEGATLKTKRTYSIVDLLKEVDDAANVKEIKLNSMFNVHFEFTVARSEKNQ